MSDPRQQLYRPPAECPVCGDHLFTTRLGCHTCGTEIAGNFQQCEFCELSQQQSDLLRMFLTSRGNLREVARLLGVSYPTARARLNELLSALGLVPDADPGLTREQVLAEVQSGALTPEEAAELLAGLERSADPAPAAAQPAD